MVQQFLDYALQKKNGLESLTIVSQLKAALLREHRLARQDALTGLGNRRAFMESLKETNGGDVE